MNKAIKSFRNFIVLTVLATILMAATGCGGHKLCSSYGGKQPSANQAEIIH